MKRLTGNIFQDACMPVKEVVGHGEWDDPGSCENCLYSQITRDPYATGDWGNVLIECEYPWPCPWGRE